MLDASVEVVDQDAAGVGVATGDRQDGEAVVVRGADERDAVSVAALAGAADIEERFAVVVGAVAEHHRAAAAGAGGGVEESLTVDGPGGGAEGGAGAEELSLAAVGREIEELELRAAVDEHGATVGRPGEVERRAVNETAGFDAAALGHEAGGEAVADVADDGEDASGRRPVDVVGEAGGEDLPGIGWVGVERVAGALAERDAPQLKTRVLALVGGWR